MRPEVVVQQVLLEQRGVDSLDLLGLPHVLSRLRERFGVIVRHRHEQPRCVVYHSSGAPGVDLEHLHVLVGRLRKKLHRVLLVDEVAHRLVLGDARAPFADQLFMKIPDTATCGLWEFVYQATSPT